jgi:MFS family permease
MIAASLASGFLTLFVAEFTLGAVLSLINPAATSLLSDLFAPDQRGARTAILSAGQISGQAGAFLIGGILVDYLAGHASGGAWYMSFSAWRITYLIFAVLSLVALPGLLTLPEPARQETAIRRLSIVRSFRHLVDYKAFLMPLFAGSTFGLVASSAILTWIAPILMRSYGLHAGQVGEWLSIVTLTGGLLASFLAGKLSRDAKQAGRSIVFPAAIACLVFAPFTLLALTPSAALVAGALFMIVTTSILTQVTSSIAIVTLIPNELRGLCFGIYLVLGIGFGRGVGPEMVAWLGGLFAGPNGLNIALAVVSAPCSLVAAWLFFIASARSIGHHGRLG